MSLPKFSVITTSFNHGKYIRQNIESVLQQDYPNFEHIVIDGGSSDETVEVLKSFAHLQWISEPDEGQADALNKGLTRATGDIIAWLNSDDWYFPRIFHDVAQALSDYPIVMGPCVLIDKNGQPIYRVENLERRWFDLLKYWIPYSIPCQPSIFFGRELLQEFKRHDGTFVDKELYYVMDYDLWLRIALKYPFSRRLSKPLGFYRMSESNKTSLDTPGMAYAEPEMSRVFHRHVNAAFPSEKRFSFIIPAEDSSSDFMHTLECALSQQLLDYEVLVVDYSGSKDQAKIFSNLVRQHNAEAHKNGVNCFLRHIKAREPTLVQAVCAGLDSACAPLSIIMEPGSEFDSDIVLHAAALFGNDRLALAFASKWGDAPSPGCKHFEKFGLPEGRYRLEGFMCSPPMFWCCIVRNIAWHDVRPSARTCSASLLLREFMTRLSLSGWQMTFAERLKISRQEPDGPMIERHEMFGLFTNAEMLSDLQCGFFRNPFTGILLSSGVASPIHPELFNQHQRLLKEAPPDWHKIMHYSSLENLELCVQKHPNFPSAYHFLSREYGKIGDRLRAEEFSKKYTVVSKNFEIF